MSEGMLALEWSAGIVVFGPILGHPPKYMIGLWKGISRWDLGFRNELEDLNKNSKFKVEHVALNLPTGCTFIWS